VTLTKGDNDAAEVIALSRAIGISGVRPASTVADEAAVDRVRCTMTGHDKSADDVIALARRIGISGIRPADQPSSGSASDPASQTSTQAAALSAANDRGPVSAPQPPVAARVAPPQGNSAFVILEFHGEEPLKTLQEFEARHGALSCAVNGSSARLSHGGKDRLRMLFKLPGDPASADLVSRGRGEFLSGRGTFAVTRSVNLSDYSFTTASGRLIGSSAIFPVPKLPSNAVRALGGRA
jgi:hypothetical protein